MPKYIYPRIENKVKIYTRNSTLNYPSNLSSDLALDECQSLLTILVSVLLMSISITPSAAVRIRSITVALDISRRWA